MRWPFEWLLQQMRCSHAARPMLPTSAYAQALYEKQGREKQFTSAAERDTYLNQQVAELQASAQQTADTRAQVEQLAADLGSEAMDLSQVPECIG